jgi:hypothetical protein
MQLSQHELPSLHGMKQATRPALPDDHLASAWREIDAALAPIVGERGAAALHERCLQLQSVSAAGGSSLLQTARELLAPLIGPNLTDRLLPPGAARQPSVSEQGDRLP